MFRSVATIERLEAKKLSRSIICVVPAPNCGPWRPQMAATATAFVEYGRDCVYSLEDAAYKFRKDEEDLKSEELWLKRK